MNDFALLPVTDDLGRKYWLMHKVGEAHQPIAMISDTNMRFMARCVIQSEPVNVTASGIGQSILAYRKRHKLTQQAMAERIGISRNYISQIERGDSLNLSVKVFQRIADVLTQ
jgi:DNA-binding XRE family transcriptional regulator